MEHLHEYRAASVRQWVCSVKVGWLQVASLESALSQAQARLAEHSSGSEVRAARAEQDRWRWQSEAEELRALLASRDREIGKMQIKQEARLGLLSYFAQSC